MDKIMWVKVLRCCPVTLKPSDNFSAILTIPTSDYRGDEKPMDIRLSLEELQSLSETTVAILKHQVEKASQYKEKYEYLKEKLTAMERAASVLNVALFPDTKSPEIIKQELKEEIDEQIVSNVKLALDSKPKKKKGVKG